MKQTLFNILTSNGKHYKKIGKQFELLIITLMVLSIIGIIIDSYNFKNPHIHQYLYTSEIIIVIIFSLEYLSRLWTANLKYPKLGALKSRLRFILSFEGVIDLVAILPFYLPLVIEADFNTVRLLRVLMLFRILKLKRYSSSLNLFISIIRDKRKELAITV